MQKIIIKKCFNAQDTYAKLIKQKMQAYTVINLEECDIGARLLPLVISAIEGSVATLNKLQFIDCKFSDMRDVWKTTTKCKNLEYLCYNFSKNGLEAASLVSFARVISNNNKLHTIRLDVSTSESLAILLPVLQGCVNLTSLVLYWNELTNIEAVYELYQWAKYNTTLTALHTPSDTLYKIIDDCFTVNRTIQETFPVAKYDYLNELCSKFNITEEIRQTVHSLVIKDDIRNLLQGFKDKAYMAWKVIKLVLLGHGRVGKSTLLHTLKKYMSKLLSPEQKYVETMLLQSKNQRRKNTQTIGIDISTMKIGSGDVIVWDFGGQVEYAVTHQFLLSSEMVIYVLCYDLSANLSTQSSQISYWLNFLQSTLSFSQHNHTQWKVIIVGTKQDLCLPINHFVNPVPAWQAQWPNISLHNQQFITSSITEKGTLELHDTLENICNNIFENHSMSVPSIYYCFYHAMLRIHNKDCVISLTDLQSKCARYMKPQEFSNAVTFLHSVGHLVLLPGGLVCTRPNVIPKIAAKFISPEKVQAKLLAKEPVNILSPHQIEIVMTQEGHKRVKNELVLMEHIGVCFKLANDNTVSNQVYLFPSLATLSDKFAFASKDTTNLHFAGMRVIAPTGKIFTAGFLCQLFVKYFAGFNVTQKDLLSVHHNGIVIACKEPFMGQLIVKMENDPNTLVFLMAGLNPDIAFAAHIFDQLVEKQLPNYGIIVAQLLCPKCIEKIADTTEIGTINEGFALQVCQPHMHTIINCGKSSQIEDITNILERMCLQLPQEWKGVKIEALIGQGGCGTVWKGELNGTIVAVKKIPIRINNPDLTSLGSEIGIAAKLKHNYVLPILGIFSLATDLWLIMEFGDGESLYSQLTDLKKDIPWSTRWQWAVQATSAIAYLHSVHIIHRDIKSPNFVISKGVLKITDFGLSVNRAAVTSSYFDYEIGGSLPWLAPECTADINPKNNKQSDVFSLGMVLWEIASRQIPFSDITSERTLISEVQSGKRPDIHADCPMPYKIIIKKCWDQLPENRPSALELMDMVQHAAQNAAATQESN